MPPGVFLPSPQNSVAALSGPLLQELTYPSPAEVRWEGLKTGPGGAGRGARQLFGNLPHSSGGSEAANCAHQLLSPSRRGTGVV